MPLICSSWIRSWSRPSSAIGSCGNDRGHGVGGRARCRGSRARRGFAPSTHRDQLELGAQHGDQRGLAADQQPGDVEAVLGQQRVEVVARDAARDVGVARADLVAVVVAQPPQRAVDRRPDGRRRRSIAAYSSSSVGAAPEPRAVVESAPRGGRCCRRPCRCAARWRRRSCCRSCRRACSSGASPARGRTRARARRAARLSSSSTMPGSTTQRPRVRVDRDQPVAVLGPVDHDGGVGALAGQAGAAAAGHDGAPYRGRPRPPRPRRRRCAGRPRRSAPAGSSRRRSSRPPGSGVEAHLAVAPSPSEPNEVEPPRRPRVIG